MAVAHLNQATPLASTILQMAAAAMGILLLVGLWTPVMGTLVAILEVCIAFVASDFLISILLATLSATLAMIGPGAWSIDAMLFGRRRIGTLER
ncbi:MAG TPA: hypothetical protein VG759_08435 [Candidatus Angelobacter sp.]|nr:hypothetical protein [Candidatus Angelobacter sp.]